MREYEIPGLPEEIDELLYNWQRFEIRQKIESPIITVAKGDPIWTQLDDRLTSANNIMSLSKNGEVECSVHELLPGVNAVWIEDSYPYSNPDESAGECILINAQDLTALREGGFNGLIQYVLFKKF